MAEQAKTTRAGARLPCVPASVPRARALLRAVLGAWGLTTEVAENAELIISELVTNALRVEAPADRGVGVAMVLDCVTAVLRIEVCDGGGGRPQLGSFGQDDTGGRGLLLVDALAQDWGVRTHLGATGKTVWAELKA